MNYVLTLAIGPVQSFIASARRSRDLWTGSWLLSELAKAVAKNLQQRGATMIFPHLNGNNTLPESVGNKIQVVFNNISAEDLKKYAEDAKEAANQKFLDFANEAKNKLGNQGEKLRLNVWELQKSDYVEVQYAWAGFSDDAKYLDASQKAAELLAARKTTRDFSALPTHSDVLSGLPKSSLDGARETVLPEDSNQALRKKLGLSQSEQLDCVGVIKRLCGDPEQFTPITRVAADSWIVEVLTNTEFQAAFEQVKEAYEALVKSGWATRVLGNQGIYADFPYDAQYLYSFRLNAERSKAEQNDKQLFDHLQCALKPIWKEFGEPCPYFAMLLADGDRMGELLDKAQTQENHQAITKNLSAFAESVAGIMRKNQAQCIYSGGDDVLGLVALNHSVKCAEDLQQEFSGSLKNIAEQLNAPIPTLSVGLAICHITTPLGNIRALAKRAEKIAKGDSYPKDKQRNALGITLAVRSGTTVDMRLRWDDKEALDLFGEWIKAYSNGGLSSRIAYDCRDIFMRTDFPMKTDDVNLLNKIRAAEMKRMLEKARDANGKQLDDRLIMKLESRLKSISGLDTQNGETWENANDTQPENNRKTADLDQLATELIIARWLAAKTQRDLGRDGQ